MATRKSAKDKAPAAAPGAVTVPGLSVEQSELLVQIAAATRNEAHPFMYVNKEKADAIGVAGFVEVHPDYKNEQGEHATRANDAGLHAADAYVAAKAAAAAPAPAAPTAPTSPFGTSASTAFPTTAPAPAPVAAPVAAPTAPTASQAPVDSAFRIVSGVPIPPAREFGKRAIYPFDSLNVGQCFFVAATADKPNPAKSLASTVNSARKRLEGRDFALRRIEDGADFGHKGVAGAAIWRTK